MRVLHVIARLDTRSGGPAVALAGLALAQTAAGMNVRIVAGRWRDGDDSAADELVRQGIPAQIIGPVTGPLSRHPALRPTLETAVGETDIVHTHGLWEEIHHLAAVAAKNAGKPLVITPHGMLDPWALRQHQLRKQIYMAWRLRKNLNRAAALHFTTAIERDLTKRLSLKAPAIIEPNGIDFAEFENPPPDGTFRAKFPQTRDRPLILFMSRLHHKKGLDKLIPAFARLKDRRAILAIAGPNSEGYQPTVEKMIAAEGVGDRTFFTGMLWREDRVAALADADLFVLPSYQENFGISVIESLAAGTPVVISDQVNIYPEIAAAGVGGVVPMDVDRLTTEIDRWLGDENLRRTAGEKGRVFARDRFDWNQIARRWGEHYKHVSERFSGREERQGVVQTP